MTAVKRRLRRIQAQGVASGAMTTNGQKSAARPDPAVTAASKFMSLVLRRQPDQAGLTLDPGGWVGIDDLLSVAGEAGVPLDRAMIAHVLAESAKARFALSSDGARIRAMQGHSAQAIEIAFEQVAPPDTLLHGAVAKFLASIRAEGLKPGERHYVHLSHDVEAARAVGARRGKPVIPRVAAGRMAREGHVSRRAENGVWLTRAVPARYLDGVEDA